MRSKRWSVRTALRFGLLALVLTWAGWLPFLLHARGASVPGGQRWHLFGSLGPFVTAFLVVALEQRP